MTDQTTKPQLEALLRSGVAAARAGRRGAARDLFLAMSRVYPTDVRVWLGLAKVAADDDEQRRALEQVLALDPQHLQARQRLAQLAPPPEAVPPPLTPTPTPTAPPAAPEQPVGPHTPHFPLLNRLALVVIVLLLLGIIALFGIHQWGVAQPVATQPTQPTAILQVDPSPSPLPTLIPTAAPPIPSTPPTRPPLPPTLPAPSPTPPTSLPLGMVVEADGWSTTLLRPDYSLVFDTSIGELQPSGRFVLVLMAVANNSAEARLIPLDLFTLVDARGRSFSPLPNASSTYLSLYPRGQYGDLALEERLAAQSGMRSVPIIFDVPRDATGLKLMVRASGNLGWPIEQPTPSTVNVGP
ncbi:hypothetical protein [Candidatus Oscillochloris fontis]|uniref:hypothetical protein n=1 Tax=Candidatus Oscillochloris fontis TaxID=2496868 RepID=UPI00101C2583|nr:hypothetical protein [Candidatus Oscillochloris fontis]